MLTYASTIKNIKKGINQRLFYIRNVKYGFSYIFLLPGSIREKFGQYTFFRTLIKHNHHIKFSNNEKGNLLIAGDITLQFPPNCFFEYDFFDILYPRLGLHNQLIEKIIYQNPYYESEGKYEDFGVKVLEGDYVVDAGANVGLFSVVASAAVGKEGKVFAFEPLTEISNVLDMNMKRNNRTNVKIVNNLLGEADKNVEFFYNFETNYNGASKAIHHEGDTMVILQQVTLDSFVKNNNIQKIDFIKADIEGAERDLLKGAEHTIKKFRPKLALRTYHLPDDKEVLFALVKEYVPEYNVILENKTLYAWI